MMGGYGLCHSWGVHKKRKRRFLGESEADFESARPAMRSFPVEPLAVSTHQVSRELGGRSGGSQFDDDGALPARPQLSAHESVHRFPLLS